MSVRKALAWSYGAQAFTFAVNFVSSVVVARILGPYELGVFALAMATAGILSILSQFGVGPYLMRHEDLDADTTTTVFTVNAILNVVISSGMFVVALLGDHFGLDRRVASVLTIIAVGPLVGIFEFLPSTLLTREMRFRALAVISMGKVIVTSVSVVAFALSGFGSLSPALAIFATVVYGVVASNIAGWRHARFRLGLRGWRDVTSFGFHMMTIGGAASITQRISELALGKVMGLAVLGVYVRASSLADQVWGNVYGQATRVVFAKMAEEMRETGSLSKTFLHGISLITALIWPFLAGIAVLSGPFIHLLYGEKWIDAAVPLSLLMVAHIIALGFGMNWELCVLTRRTAWQSRVEITRTIVGTVSFVAGTFVSLAAASFGRILEASTGLILYAPKMREMAGTKPGDLSKVFRESALLTLAAVVPAFALMCWNRWSVTTSLPMIAAAVLLGIGLWAAALRGLRHPLWDEAARWAARLGRSV